MTQLSRIFVVLPVALVSVLLSCGSETVGGGPSDAQAIDFTLPEDSLVTQDGDPGDTERDLPIETASTPETTDSGPTPDTMDPDIVAPLPCEDDTFCDDGDPCTHTDNCIQGACVGEPYACSDGKECTHDFCDGGGGCTYPLRSDRCFIAGACYQDGESQPDNPCMACVVPFNQTSWTPSDGATCDDDLFCTVSDECIGGTCVGLEPKSCDDDNYCTDDGCSNETGCTHAANTRTCDDGDPCTIGDSCENKLCWPGPTIVTCDDNNPCTNDVCVQGEGCLHTDNTNPCDDDSVCTQGEQCGGGSCQPGAQILNCADTNSCTDDICHPVLGCMNVNNQEACDDGNVCSDGDQCVFGQCVAGPGITNCNDGNPCTTDSCDPQQGGCVAVPSFGACDDGDPCTIGDFCQAGQCAPGGVQIDCDDGNDCTLDHCDASGQCAYTNVDDVCDDDDPCTLMDRCFGGACKPGHILVVCNDDNPCTLDFCEPGVGCQHAPSENNCTDGDACTVGDECVNGNCQPGSQPIVCDDQNVCTADTCDPSAGCVFIPIEGASCDDGNDCSFDDSCTLGICQGQDSPCDDENLCTQDICLPGGGCDYELIDSPECKPTIVVTYPPRAAMLLGPPNLVTVTGSVSSQGGAITEFLINDSPVQVQTDGSFEFAMTPQAGMNIIRVFAANASGGYAKAVRAYQFSHIYYPITEQIPPVGTVVDGQIPDGLKIYLGPEVFDDDNTNTPDDFATLALLALGGFQLEELIPTPLSTQQILHCDAVINGTINNYQGPELDLYPIEGGLHAKVTITNIDMDIDAQTSGFLCPDATGDVTADSIIVDVDLMVSISPTGEVVVSIEQKSAQVVNLDVSLDGVLGFLTNWLVNLFEGDIASELENQVVNELDQFKDVLAETLGSLTLNESLTFPSLLGSGSPVEMQFITRLMGSHFQSTGAVLDMRSSVHAAKAIPYDPLGSVGRSGCLAGNPGAFSFFQSNEIDIGLYDDLLNQIFYAGWYGGALEFFLGEQDIPDVGSLEQFGVQNLAVDVSFMLPPTLNDCAPDGVLRLQFGDIHIHASLTLAGQPLETDAYASASAVLSVAMINTDNGPELSFEIAELESIDLEVESVSTGGAGTKYVLTSLIENSLLPVFFDTLADGFATTLPIPEIDISGNGTTLPPGTTFKIVGSTTYRKQGYTVLSGDVQ